MNFTPHWAIHSHFFSFYIVFIIRLTEIWFRLVQRKRNSGIVRIWPDFIGYLSHFLCESTEESITHTQTHTQQQKFKFNELLNTFLTEKVAINVKITRYYGARKKKLAIELKEKKRYLALALFLHEEKRRMNFPKL